MRAPLRHYASFHEPNPLIPSFSPSGGEGARRADEGDFQRFMAPIRVQSLEVFPLHEPESRSRRGDEAEVALITESASSRQRLRFMVPMRIRIKWGQPMSTDQNFTLSSP
jgi:hypothetical protein